MRKMEWSLLAVIGLSLCGSAPAGGQRKMEIGTNRTGQFDPKTGQVKRFLAAPTNQAG